MNIHRVQLPGRLLFMNYREHPGCLVGQLIPLTRLAIREWLAQQRHDGHLAHVALPTFHSVPLDQVDAATRSGQWPLYLTQPVTYLFADPDIALTFKLTFGGRWGL